MMTRFDLYIRKMMLDSMSLSYLELSPHQEAVLSDMIRETYTNEALSAKSIEERVAYVVKQHRNQMYSHVS